MPCNFPPGRVLPSLYHARAAGEAHLATQPLTGANRHVLDYRLTCVLGRSTADAAVRRHNVSSSFILPKKFTAPVHGLNEQRGMHLLVSENGSPVIWCGLRTVFPAGPFGTDTYRA